MQPRTKLCVGITACLVLVLSIIALVMVFLIKTRDSTSNVVVDDLQRNFNSKGINDIKYSNGNQCPQGTEPLFNFDFPGTDYICSCTNDETGRKKLVSIYKSACVFVSGHTCKKIKMDPAKLHRFKGKLLCAVKSEFSYEGYHSIAKNGTCPDNTWRVCGHTASRKLCLPKTEPCPINSVIISKANMEPTKIIEGNYKTIKLDDDYKMYFSNRKTGNQIITDFKTSFENPCISPEEVKVPVDYEASGLNNSWWNTEECEETLGTDSAVDPRWKKEVGYSQLNMFNDNGYFQDYESTSAVNMKSLASPKHYVYSRGYSDWNRQCMSNPSQSINQNFSNLKSDQEGESKWGLSVAAIVLLILAIISALIWLVYTFTKNANVNFIKCCCVWLCLVLLAAIVVLGLLFMRATKDYPENSKHYMKDGCGDATSTGLIQKIAGNKSNFLKYAGWALGLTGLAWLLLCCLPCCFGKAKANFDDDVMRSNRKSNYTELVEDDYQDHVFDPNAGYQAYPDMKKETVVYKKTIVKAEPAPVTTTTTYITPAPVTTTTYVEPERRVTTNYVAPEPERRVTTTYVAPEPERRVTTNYVAPENTTTTYVTPAPVTTTTYVEPERRVTTNYVAPNTTTTYVTEPTTTTRYVNEPTTTTRYVNEPTTTTRYVNEPTTTTRYVNEPTTTTRYVNEPTTTTRFVNEPTTTTRYVNEPTTTVTYVDGNPTYTSSGLGSGNRTYDDQGRLITRIN